MAVDWDTKETFKNTYRGRALVDADRVVFPPVYIHFNRVMQKPSSDRQRDRLIKALQLTSTSSIVLIGGAFGWTADSFQEMWPGFDIAVTDTSLVVQNEARATDEAEITAAIIAAGHDPKTGDGAKILAKYASPGRNRAIQTVIAEDSMTKQSGTLVKARLTNAPDWIVTTGILSDLSDTEAVALDTKLRNTYAPASIAHVVTMLRTNDPEEIDPPNPMREFQSARAAQMNLKNLAAWKALLPKARVIENRYKPAYRVDFL